MRQLQFTALILGIDEKRLQAMPRDEQRYYFRIAVQMAATFVFLFIMDYAALITALGQSPSALVMAGIMALVIAALVVLIDISIIDGSIFAHGERELAKFIACQGEPIIQRLKRIAPRIVLALILSTTIGMFADLVIFKPEIDQMIEQVHRRENAALVEEVQSGIRREISDKQAAITALVAESDGLLKSMDTIEGVNGGASARASSEIASLDQKLKELADKKLRLAEERGLAEQTAQLEGDGVALQGRTTGKKGCGNACRQWQSEKKRIADQIADTEAEVTRLQGERSRLEAERNGIAEKMQAGESAATQAKRAARAEIETRLTAARSKLAALERDAAGEADKRVAADLRYVRRREGLAARFVALKEVGIAYPSTLPVMILISLSIMALELGTILSVELSGRKLAYALHTVNAYNTELHIHRRRNEARTASEAMARFNAAPTYAEPKEPDIPQTASAAPAKSAEDVAEAMFAKYVQQKETAAKVQETVKAANGAAAPTPSDAAPKKKPGKGPMLS